MTLSRFSHKRGLKPILMLAALLMATLSSSAFADSSEAVVVAGPRVPRVSVAMAEIGELIVQVPVSGSLLPRTEILIYPQVSGFIVEQVFVDVGDRVAAGDVLAQMNARTLQAQLAQAEAERTRAEAAVRQARSQIASAEANQSQADAALERATRLANSGNVSTASLDTARASAETARATAASATDGLAVSQAMVAQAAAQADIARLNVENATITAPVDGLILAKTVEVGAITAMGGDPMFRLIKDGLIEIEAEVIETALGQIKVGDRVALDIAGVGQVEGSVRRLSPFVDDATRLGTVRIETAAQEGLRAGLFAAGLIITDRHEGITVPASAVLTDSKATFVLKVKDGVVHRQKVTAGLIWEKRREILEGVAEGDVVIEKAGSFFTDGDKVRPEMTGEKSSDPIETSSAAGPSE